MASARPIPAAILLVEPKDLLDGLLKLPGISWARFKEGLYFLLSRKIRVSQRPLTFWASLGCG
jgi:hypothetical protein